MNKVLRLGFVALLLTSSMLSVFASEITCSLSSATSSKGVGIIDGQITYFTKENGSFGVRIDKIDFRGEWCSHNLIAGNRQCNFEIELWREGELFGEGNWLTSVISKQQVTRDIISNKHCPSGLPNPANLFDFARVDYLAVTCPSLIDFTTNFQITENGNYFIKVRMHHNDFTTDWSTHKPTSLIIDQTEDHSHPSETSAAISDYPLGPLENESEAAKFVPGHWKGWLYQFDNLKGIPSVFQYSLDLNIINGQIKGSSRIESDGSDGVYYAVMELTGSISDDVLSLIETKVLEKNMPNDWYFTLKKADLNFVRTTPLTLEGPWVCANGNAAPGSIFLVKQ